MYQKGQLLAIPLQDTSSGEYHGPYVQFPSFCTSFIGLSCLSFRSVGPLAVVGGGTGLVTCWESCYACGALGWSAWNCITLLTTSKSCAKAEKDTRSALCSDGPSRRTQYRTPRPRRYELRLREVPFARPTTGSRGGIELIRSGTADGEM